VVNLRRVQYSNLSPGDYRFCVMASNNSGVWNEAGDTLEFYIAPAYYQTNLFRAACVAGFFLVLWGLYRYRLYQIARQFHARLGERVEERTRIARELHDTILQSFQAALFEFQAARNLLSKGRADAIQTLDSAIASAQEAIVEGRDAIHDLRRTVAPRAHLEDLLRIAAQELASSQSSNGDVPAFWVTVEGPPQGLPPLLQDEVYQIGREVLRNAFRHASAHRIEAEIRYDENLLRLRIRDDGKGIDQKLFAEGNLAGHWGLPGMRERAKRIGARLIFWSEVGAGTEVELAVPARIAYANSRFRRRFGLFRNHREAS
jgi:signal transduction histidine kinase